MNTHSPEKIPVGADAASIPLATEPPYRLRRIFLALLLVAALADLCFWGVTGLGFSLGVFFPVLALLILSSRATVRWTRTTVVLFALLAGASFAAMIECGVANMIVLVVLTMAIAGESYFTSFESPWARVYLQGVALLLAPARPFWLAARINSAVRHGRQGRAQRIVAAALLCLPALVLALVFGSLLASANGVMGLWLDKFFNWLGSEITGSLDIGRIAFWVFAMFLALPLIRPAWIRAGWWDWIPRVGPLAPMASARSAIFSSALVLAVLNLVFLVANVADVLFLWSGAALPAGVTYKSYVHDGVNTLIFTVLLTAMVLTALFQQEPAVSKHRLLKGLALAWIAQNLVLLANCALRLKHYIVDYELTIARESCLIFLALVATGFVLLTVKILRDRSLPWLVGGCVLASFVTFYATQFLNLYGWSADYNVAVYEKNHWHTLDRQKLYEAGPAAWPALRQVREFDPSVAFVNRDLNLGPDTSGDAALAQFDGKHWREFSLRAYWNRWALPGGK